MTDEAFRKLLAKAGVSQAEAARRLGYTSRHVNRWATGKQPISSAVAALIRERIKPKK